MTSHSDINQATWNTWVDHDTQSEHHQDVARFRSTGSSLHSLEVHELGDVAGKTLLHLQCNMGADTLSWAQRGAQVTGIDLSDRAIAKAQELATASNTPARFITTDLYALPDHLSEQFDIVFTSYGVLWWLADLQRWALIVAAFIKPGGTFYMVDMHPFTNCLAVAETAPLSFTVVAPYAHPTEPLQVLSGTPDASVRTWTYSLGEVVTALMQAGLHLTFVHEHSMQFYQQFAVLERDADGWWRWPPATQPLPLLFSLKAEKPR
ncbi:MAG: class I SAM-dependent methyltransferase [Ktedonobacterales bacterium]|nr:class I SAM-dependent methyltransferase [Ktedonobacterales bacterium]